MRIFVAGTFDHFHVGHQSLLWQAYGLASEMVVIVAREGTVEKIKKRKPRNKEEFRVNRVKMEFEGFDRVGVRLGREDGNFWKTLEEECPDIIYLGYDQGFDEEACRVKFPSIRIMRAKPFFPEFFKSSKF